MLKLWTVLFLLSISISSYASDENGENVEDYDSIVNSLSTVRTDARPSKNDFDFNSLNFHFEFGFTNSLLNLRSNGPSPSQVSVGGVMLGLGIDLFSPEYIAEVTYTNSNPSDKDNYSYQMSEYDLRVYYHHGINSLLNGKAGAGIGSRELKISGPSSGGTYNTPEGQIFAGLEILLGRHLGFETDVTYKNALSNNTPERSSLDLGLGVNGHF